MNENENIITIEDEIKEFSDKPVKSSALYKKIKELEEGGGGVPEGYPLEKNLLYTDTNPTYDAEQGAYELNWESTPYGNIIVTINGTEYEYQYYDGYNYYYDDGEEFGAIYNSNDQFYIYLGSTAITSIKIEQVVTNSQFTDGVMNTGAAFIVVGLNSNGNLTYKGNPLTVGVFKTFPHMLPMIMTTVGSDQIQTSFCMYRNWDQVNLVFAYDMGNGWAFNHYRAVTQGDDDSLFEQYYPD